MTDIFKKTEKAKNNESSKTVNPLTKAIKAQDINVFSEAMKSDPASVNAKDEDGTYPLHYAIISEKLPFVKELIRNKADISAGTSEEKITPLL